MGFERPGSRGGPIVRCPQPNRHRLRKGSPAGTARFYEPRRIVFAHGTSPNQLTERQRDQADPAADGVNADDKREEDQQG